MTVSADNINSSIVDVYVKMEDSSAKRVQYRCEPCDKDFTTKKGWKKHSDKHHPVSDEGSECGGESMSFRTANSTTFHPCPYDDCDKFFNRPNRQGYFSSTFLASTRRKLELDNSSTELDRFQD